ncbi:MAG: hypothetical protein ACFCU9_05760 [Cyanophyceae cyanobacterium]
MQNVRMQESFMPDVSANNQPPIEQVMQLTSAAWSAVEPPNATALEMAAAMDTVISGFERQRGIPEFENEPAAFEAVLLEVKEVLS